jgi:hypothetical protein
VPRLTLKSPPASATHSIAKDLLQRTVAVKSLTTHTRNPRHGDVAAIATSLERFGQVRAILVSSDGEIIAGNHTYMAAVSLGWTHIAATLFTGSREDAEAYLIADNRASDLGTYDYAILADLLRDVKDRDDLAATLYSTADLDLILSRTAADTADDPWDGMPEYQQDDVQPYSRVTVSFLDAAAEEEFFRMIDRPVRKSLWWPHDDGHVGSSQSVEWVAEGEPTE